MVKAGVVAPGDGGKVLLPYTSAKLGLRFPPTLNAAEATASVRALLEADPPYGAKVSFSGQVGSTGGNAPALASWLEASFTKASQDAFGAPAAFIGAGGDIPFRLMLGGKFPAAAFVVPRLLRPPPHS